MVVKDNHPLLHRKIARFFQSSCLFEATFASACTQEVSRGRIETRRLLVSSDFPTGYTGFPGVSQLFCIERSVCEKKSGRFRHEIVYGMTSLSAKRAKPKRLLCLLRGHWHIENKSHYVRDVTFDEDRSQVRCGNIPQVLAALRNACISLMRLNGQTNIASACRYYAANPEAALELLRIQKTE